MSMDFMIVVVWTPVFLSDFLEECAHFFSEARALPTHIIKKEADEKWNGSPRLTLTTTISPSCLRPETS